MNDRSSATVDLFTPCDMGPLHLKNRMVMAPLTRSRAEEGNVPSRMAATYYSQRAQAGLIVTEATQASAGGQGYIATPAIHSDDQVRGWRKVTDAVHRALEVYRDRVAWRRLQRTGMAQDFSWEHSAAEYVQVYKRAART